MKWNIGRKCSNGLRTGIELGLCALLFLSVGGCGFASGTSQVTISDTTAVTESTAQQEASADAAVSAATTQQEVIYVHVCGAVRNSGVYCLPAGARVVDAVQVAGGFRRKAAAQQVNQAEPLQDGQQLYIPYQGESSADQTTGQQTGQQEAKVNLNEADAAQLMTLPGIGEARAQAILDYRQAHGAFQDVSELKQVDGIKDAIYDKLKNNITVG